MTTIISINLIVVSRSPLNDTFSKTSFAKNVLYNKLVARKMKIPMSSNADVRVVVIMMNDITNTKAMMKLVIYGNIG
jgi:hypothetical protein